MIIDLQNILTNQTDNFYFMNTQYQSEQSKSFN